ncbi:MAG: glycosyltransferase [bacterium]
MLTIYIVHYRRLDKLKKTIEHIKKNTTVNHSVKILNNGYINESIKEYLEELNSNDNYEIIYSSENIGASRGRAKLVEGIETPFLMSLDDDMYLQPGWCEPIFKMFAKHSDVGAMGCILTEDVNSNEKKWKVCGRNFNIKNGVLKMSRPKIHENVEKYLHVDDLCSGCIVYRKELSSTIKWDPEYFVGFEDLQKGIYLMNCKYKSYISTDSKIIHDKMSDSIKNKEYNKTRRDYKSMRKSYLIFVKKNGLKFDFKRHIFYKYFCLTPPAIVRFFTYTWLRIKKRIY